MTFDEVVKIAKEYDDRVNHCIEYHAGYEFYSTDWSKDGGPDERPFIVVKSTGVVMPPLEYYEQYPDGESLQEMDF